MSEDLITPVGSTPALDAALDALHASTGHRPPCWQRPDWTSDDPDKRAHAAEACQWCPVLDVCRDAAREIGATAGVWAGVDIEAAEAERLRARRAERAAQRAGQGPETDRRTA